MERTTKATGTQRRLFKDTSAKSVQMKTKKVKKARSHFHKDVVPPSWVDALPWLNNYHTTTAEEAEELEMYFGMHPHAAQEKHHGRRLPLHYAAWKQQGEHGLAVIKLLLAVYPNGLFELNKLGRLPLHLAAMAQSGEHGATVVMTLLAANPQAAREKDLDGRLPLHLAAMEERGEHAVQVIRALLGAYPEGAQQEDNYGCLPLHCAPMFQSGQHAVAAAETLLSAHPLAAQHTDAMGCLPLHHAACHHEGEHSVPLVKILLAAYPTGAQQADHDGWLPLHLVARYQSGEHAVALVTALLTAYSGAAMRKDKYGYLPLHCSVHNPSFPSECADLLREAAKGRWQPADAGKATRHLAGLPSCLARLVFPYFFRGFIWLMFLSLGVVIIAEHPLKSSYCFSLCFLHALSWSPYSTAFCVSFLFNIMSPLTLSSETSHILWLWSAAVCFSL